MNKDKLISTLNELLAAELTAIKQYMAHAEMCEQWRYDRLHNMSKNRSITEMRHAEKLMGHILSLGGAPDMAGKTKMTIGKTVEEQQKNDLELEKGAIESYKDAIKLAEELNDKCTKDILELILGDEKTHKDELVQQLDEIEKMGVKSYSKSQSTSIKKSELKEIIKECIKEIVHDTKWVSDAGAYPTSVNETLHDYEDEVDVVLKLHLKIKHTQDQDYEDTLNNYIISDGKTNEYLADAHDQGSALYEALLKLLEKHPVDYWEDKIEEV
jgi:bacterioferritin